MVELAGSRAVEYRRAAATADHQFDAEAARKAERYGDTRFARLAPVERLDE